MELQTLRISTGLESTLGILHVVGQGVDTSFRCFTMEDQPNEPKVPGETRIPAGRYQILLRNEGGMNERYKEKFAFHRGMLHLQAVPNFTFVYIHYGNFDDETDGCILVGDGAKSNVIADGMVSSSVAAYERLYKEVITAMDDGEEVFITVEDYA